MSGSYSRLQALGGGEKKRKKIEVLGNHPNRVVILKKQTYQDNNPYSLTYRREASTPYTYRPKNSQQVNRDNFTETSSQRSGKIIRANCLKKASKPNLSLSNASQKNQTNSRLDKSNVSNSPYQIPQPYSHQNNKKHEAIQRQNIHLRAQNQRLKQQLAQSQQNKASEINSLKNRIQQLFKQSSELEKMMRNSDKQWQNYIYHSQAHKNAHNLNEEQLARNYSYNYNYNIMMVGNKDKDQLYVKKYDHNN